MPCQHWRCGLIAGHVLAPLPLGAAHSSHRSRSCPMVTTPSSWPPGIDDAPHLTSRPTVSPAPPPFFTCRARPGCRCSSCSWSWSTCSLSPTSHLRLQPPRKKCAARARGAGGRGGSLRALGGAGLVALRRCVPMVQGVVLIGDPLAMYTIDSGLTTFVVGLAGCACPSCTDCRSLMTLCTMPPCGRPCAGAAGAGAGAAPARPGRQQLQPPQDQPQLPRPLAQPVARHRKHARGAAGRPGLGHRRGGHRPVPAAGGGSHAGTACRRTALRVARAHAPQGLLACMLHASFAWLADADCMLCTCSTPAGVVRRVWGGVWGWPCACNTPPAASLRRPAFPCPPDHSLPQKCMAFGGAAVGTHASHRPRTHHIPLSAPLWRH